MQGRLLPKIKNRYQCFPGKNWAKEFYLAKKLKLDLIELIFDIYEYKINPLYNLEELKKLKKIIRKTNIEVKTVCADYFMNNTLFEKNTIKRNDNIKMLKYIINNCKKIGITDIVIPLVDSSSIKGNKLKNETFTKSMINMKSFLKFKKINICLETDLEPKAFLKLIRKINSRHIKINYDTGNSASLGYSINSEFKTYGRYITDLHVKDRMFKGGPVMLGKGSVRFDALKKALKNKKVKPNYIIFQSYRDNKPIYTFKKQQKWFMKNVL